VPLERLQDGGMSTIEQHTPRNDAEPAPDDERAEAIARLKKQRDFQSHFIVYVVVNAAFWGLWITTDGGYPWPAWISGLWGIGLILNGWDVYLRMPITEADIDREIGRLRSR